MRYLESEKKTTSNACAELFIAWAMGSRYFVGREKSCMNGSRNVQLIILGQ